MNVSDKYRKYFICIKFLDKKLFAIWGTDLNNNEQDKFVISKSGKIICSKDFNFLKEYLLVNTDLLFDVNNLMFWLLNNEDFEPSATYDFDNVDYFIEEFQNINFINNSEMMIEVVNFINLTLDYSIQVKNSYIIEILNNRNLLTYKDYVYNNFLWNSSSSQIILKTDEEFDKKQLCMDLRKVFNFIKKRIVEI